MNKALLPIVIIGGLLVLICLVSSIYFVDETNQVVITQFGEPIGDPIKDPGMHVKVPFIQHCNYFDKRLLEWDGDPNRIPTEDKKYIWVDITARWRIEDPLKYMQTVKRESAAQQRLDGILDGAVRNIISRNDLIETVRDSNRILSLEVSEDEKIMDKKHARIPGDSGREVITRAMLKDAKPKVKKFGIELVDIRIKRINYDQQVRQKVFDRMISERKRAAELLRAEGQGARAEIEGKKEKELQRIQSEAYRKAQEIQGKADAKAINIYADAYSKDPEFYAFRNTLDSHHAAVTDRDTLILTTDSEFFKYMKEIGVE